MKKFILLLSSCFTYLNSFSQTKLVPGEIKGNHDTFIIEDLKPFDSVRYIDIYSKNNKYVNGIPRPKGPHFLEMSNLDIHVDNNAIKQIILTVLRNKLAVLKQNKEKMGLNLIFLRNGALADVSYSLHKNTLISFEEIEEIDESLRENIKATFTGKQYLQYEAIYYDKAPYIVF